MRTAAKEVHKIRGRSRKEVPEVQTFRWENRQTGVLKYDTRLYVSRSEHQTTQDENA